MTSTNNYVVYHLHSDLSNGVTSIDSVTKFKQYVDRAKECGMTALAFSEHGSVFSWLDKKETIEKAGMKYIHAEEFYVCNQLERLGDDGKRVRENYHVVLIAKNYNGVLELNKLSSKSFDRNDGHFYFLPRITMDELEATSNNIIVTTACLASPLSKGHTEIRNRFLKFVIINKDRCYLEIQHHNVDAQKHYNEILLKIHNQYGVPLIAGTDTHALNTEHAEARLVLQKAKNVYFDGEDGWDLTWKTYNELVDAYKIQNVLPMNVVLEAINNTNKMADRIEPFEVDRSKKYPHLWENPEKTLQQNIIEGIKRRGIKSYPNYDEYVKRVNYEYSVFKHNGAIDFILLMVDVANYCREHGIQLGYGRGSVNGSVICWILGITEMDSIKFGLNFERFMNTERVSLADIDSDIPPNRRDELIDYLFNHKDLYCSDIITFNTIALKGAVRDICRGLYRDMNCVNYLEVTDEISKHLDNDEQAMRERYSEVFKYVDLVNGVVISIGTHPCGRLVSDHPIDGEIGMCSTSTDNHMISQLWMHELDSMNYIKLDLLALDTIQLIADTCKLAKIPMLLPSNMNVDDNKVWDSIRDDTTGIFQWESNTASSYIKKLLSDNTIDKFKKLNKNVDKMELLTIGNSAIRPAGESYRDDLASGIIRTTGDKAIDEFLKPTFGYLVYQCTIIEFLHSYCGFTMGQADVVRRGFAKKLGTDQFIPVIRDGGYMPSDTKHEHYIDGFVKTMHDKYNMDEETAKRDIADFLRVIEDASSYLFSRNHSQPYSFEGYACGWLRYYYPTEFLTVALTINKDNEDKTKALVKYAQAHDITISNPVFRHAMADYSCDPSTKTIYKGVSSIKNVGSKAGDYLYSLRDNKYDTFVDLLKDLKSAYVNSETLDILIKIEYFSEFGDIYYLLQVVAMYNKYHGRKQFKKQTLIDEGIPIELVKKYGKETEKQIAQVDSDALLNELISTITYKPCPIQQKIKYQQDLLGYVSYKMPDANHRAYMIMDIGGKRKMHITAYELYSGKTREFVCWSNVVFYRDTPLVNKSDIIIITQAEKRHKQAPSQYKINPKTGKPLWVDIPDQFEMWLEGFYVTEDPLK